MRYRLYIDSYFFMNFMLDCFALLLTGGVIRVKLTCLRAVLSAALSAFLSCLILVLPLGGAAFKLTVCYGAAGLLTAALAYRMKWGKPLIRATLSLYAVTAALSGFMAGARNLIEGATGHSVSIAAVTGIAAGGFILLYELLLWLRAKSMQKCYCVVLKEDGRTQELTAFLDTGNSLTEPFGGRPVSIVEKEALSFLLPEDYRRANPQKSRIIPYHSIGKDHGILKGFEIEELCIRTEKGELRIPNAVLAVSENKISGRESYRMILHPELLEQADGREYKNKEQGGRIDDIEGVDTRENPV